MTAVVHLLLDVIGLLVAVLVVAAYRRGAHLDALELAMLRGKVEELERHPAVKPRPRTIEKHRRHLAGLPIVTDTSVDPGTVEFRDGDEVVAKVHKIMPLESIDKTFAREAAKHAAAAEERHEK